MGFKRIPATFWQRVVAGRKLGIACFLTLLTFFGAALTIYVSLGGKINVHFAYLVPATCIVIPLVAAFVRGRLKSLPDFIVDEMGADVPYICDFCSPDHLNEACEMTKPYYGSEYVSGAIAEQWRAKNPTAFVEIVNNKGELCACFGILAFTDSFREQFIAGRVADTQMGVDCILEMDKSKKSSTLYISGVVVRNPLTYMGRKRASIMVWAIVTYLKRIYGVRRERMLIALAANKESKELMTHLGFTLMQPGSQRVDSCNLYSYKFSKESGDKLISRIGDMSPMCSCSF